MTCEEGCECGTGPTRVVQLADGTELKIWEGPIIDMGPEVVFGPLGEIEKIFTEDPE